MRVLRAMTAVCLFAMPLGLGCEDDGGAGDAGAGGQSGGTGGDLGAGGNRGGGPDCNAGCVLTLAAACANGPATMQQCVDDCEALLAGGCGTPYAAVLTCSDGGAVTCGADGRPTVDACATEFQAFVTCLNGS